MKFSISASEIKRALNTCNEIAPASSSVAEEKTGVLISAKGDTVTFVASDDASSARVSIPAKVTKEGEALVRCSDVANSIAATFEYDESQLKVEISAATTLKISGSNRTSTGKFLNHVRSFPLLNVGFFVETPVFDPKQATEFSAIQFQDGLSAVSHAASKDTSKLHFNCISVTFNDDDVVFAATDGIQIAEFRKAAQVKGLRGSFILGLKFANVVSKHVADVLRAEDTENRAVLIYVEGDNFFMQSAETTLVGTLLNTSFPDYSSYLETTDKLVAVFTREDFLSILQGMQPTVDAKSHRMVIDATAKIATAVLSTSSVTGSGESSDLDVETSEDFVLHFDSVLLQNSVRQLKGEIFELFFTQDAKQVILKSPKDDDFTALVCTLKKVD